MTFHFAFLEKHLVNFDVQLLYPYSIIFSGVDLKSVPAAPDAALRLKFAGLYDENMTLICNEVKTRLGFRYELEVETVAS